MIKRTMPRCLTAALVALPAALLVGNASAEGPLILGGDDLTEHGSRNTAGTVVFDGWFYIQRALENIAPAVTIANDRSVAVLGSAFSMAMTDDAGAAYHFAVPLAAQTTGPAFLSGTVTFHDGPVAINQFFVDLANGNVMPAIIVSAGTDAENDQDSNEVAAMTANALGIANFVNAGGGLLAHGTDEAYGWLTALIPEATTPPSCDAQTLALTPFGQAAFPGLTNTDIRGGPCHNHFVRHGLPILAQDALVTGVTPDPPSGATVDESEPNDTFDAADPIAIGDDYSAEINPAAESDLVSFSASAGQSIVATIELGTLSEATMLLLDVDGETELAFNDDALEFTLPAAGTYFLQVDSFQNLFSGTYTLQLRGATVEATFRDVIIGGEAVSLPECLPPTVSCNVTDLGEDFDNRDSVSDSESNAQDIERVVSVSWVVSFSPDCEGTVEAVIDIGCEAIPVENGQIVDLLCLGPEDDSTSSADSGSSDSSSGDDLEGFLDGGSSDDSGSSDSSSGDSSSDVFGNCIGEFVKGILLIRSETAVLRVTVTDTDGNVVTCSEDLCLLTTGVSTPSAGTSKKR